MLYQWDCKQCGKQVEVTRSVDDRDIPPDEECELCHGEEFVRVISGGTGFRLLGKGWYRDGY